MTRTRLAMAMVCAMAMVGTAALTPALAQRGPGGQGGGGFDREAIQERMREAQERMREALLDQLNIEDADERELVGERLETVVDLRRQAQQGQGMALMGIGRGGPGGAAARGGRGQGGPQGARGGFNPFGGEPTEVDEAQESLQEVLATDSPSDADLRDALQALREARARQEQQLDEAQESLRELLTLRQEALLVGVGLLD